MIDRLAHLLPAQGPISIFIHHNTLHAFEDLLFEEAVERAGERLACEPYLSESRYREKLASGRIVASDVDALIREQLGARGARDVAGTGSRLDLWRAVVLHGIPAAAGRELQWILEGTAALSKFRTDLPASARAAAAALSESDDPAGEERRAVRRLWDACLEAAGRAAVSSSPTKAAPVRHRDWLRDVYGLDTDAWIHPALIRFLAGYLDQGLAHWPMPERSRGIHGCFLEIYRTGLAAQCGPWARALPRIVEADRATERDALGSIEHSLVELGVSADGWTEYLSAELLALRGWAGIVRQIEERPDRVPARDLTVTLRGYLAVRLLFERAALEEAARQANFDGPLAGMPSQLRDRLPRPAAPTTIERAWPLFHVAQIRGLDVSIVEQWTARHVAELESELHELDHVRRRRILHQAFERTIRHRLYDGLIGHTPQAQPASPAFQAVFCLDEREESFRRHLEEVEPACETLSTAGFFNVAMYHKGVFDAHPRPLCPVAIRPEHYVAEIEPDADRLAGRSRRLPVAVITVAPRARNVDGGRANPAATGSRGKRAADRNAFRIHGARDGGHRAPRSRRDGNSGSPVFARARHRSRIDQPQQPARVGARLRRVRRRTRRAQCPRLRADGQRRARASASQGRRRVDPCDDVVRWRAAEYLQQRRDVLRRRSHAGAVRRRVRAGERRD